MRRPVSLLASIFPAALACFVLAASTGVLYRYGILWGLPLDLGAQNVRHAHSHLMYFGWVTPVLMALIAFHVLREDGPALRTRAVAATAWSGVVLGLIAFIPFLLYGYGMARIGEARLPLAMMAAGLNVLPWYVFAGWYALAMRGRRRTTARRLFDGAVTFLVLSSSGAWMLAALSLGGADNLFLERSALHIFLDYFAEGWLVLGILGVVHAGTQAAGPAKMGATRERSNGSRTRPDQLSGAGSRRADTAGISGLDAVAAWGTRFLFIGLPVVFLLPLASSLVPAPLQIVATIGGVLVAAGTLLHVRALWPSRPAWRLVLALLTVKAIGTAAYSLPVVNEWLAMQGLRLLYLHILLLGVVTLGLVRAASQAWYSDRLKGQTAMAWSVLALFASLLPLTRLWPAALTGRWAFVVASIAAIPPILVAGYMLVDSSRRLRARPAWATRRPASRARSSADA